MIVVVDPTIPDDDDSVINGLTVNVAEPELVPSVAVNTRPPDTAAGTVIAWLMWPLESAIVVTDVKPVAEIVTVEPAPKPEPDIVVVAPTLPVVVDSDTRALLTLYDVEPVLLDASVTVMVCAPSDDCGIVITLLITP